MSDAMMYRKKTNSTDDKRESAYDINMPMACLLDAILAASKDQLLVTDLQGCITHASQSLCYTLELDKELIVGKRVEEIGAPKEIINRFLDLKQQVLAQNCELTGSFIYPLTNGPRDFTYTLSPVYDSNHSAIGIVAIFRDVHEQNRLWKTLRDTENNVFKSEQQLRLIIDALPILLCFIDSDQRYRLCNKTYESWHGFQSTDIYGCHLREVIGENSYQSILPYIEETLAGHTVYFEKTSNFGDGVVRDVMTTYIPNRRYDGVIDGFIAIMQDITDRKRVEDERRQVTTRQQIFMRDVLSSVTEGKLRLCFTLHDLPQQLPVFGQTITVTRDYGLSDLRDRIREAAGKLGYTDQRTYDILTAASEAAMNAIVHAGGGSVRVGYDNDIIQVWIEDRGTGIAVENLPRATLLRGYSSAGTMGHGMKMILQTADRFWLLTGLTGTTVVLEQDRLEPMDLVSMLAV